MEQLRGQHVLITGATGALGRSLVETVLACGANVTAVARRRTALDGLRADLRQHERLHTAEADVSDAQGTERLFDALERGTGPLDAVIHAASAFVPGPLERTDDATIDALWRAVLLSALLVTRASVRRMGARGRGRIVLVSTAAALVPTAEAVVHSALKAAVVHLARSTAIELVGRGVTVNAVVPGALDTPDQRARYHGVDPVRFVPPGEVAKAVVGLLGDGSGRVSGSVLALPDGL